MIQRLLLVIPSVAILVCTSCVNSADMNTGKAGVAHFHDELNAGLSDEIYRDAGQEYRGATTEEFNRKFVEAVRTKMGRVQRYEVTTWRVNYSTNGKFLALECKTQFTNGGAEESFQWRIDGKRPVLMGWHINSPLLVVN